MLWKENERLSAAQSSISKVINTKQDLKQYLIEDSKALFFSEKVSWWTKVKDPIWKFEKCLRYCEYYKNSLPNHPLISYPLYLFHKFRFRKLSIKLGFSIPENVFGMGLSIAHYGSIVINPNVRVGNYCRIHVGVNIGANKYGDDVPEIGNNVYIGPGAKIFGKIYIGDNTKIGANAVVNKSCEGNCTLVGVPAKEVPTQEDH